MTNPGRFALRLAIYGAAVAYIAGDLMVFNGPINRRVQSNRPDSPESIAAAKAAGAVARVFNHRILRSQLDRAVHERLWLDGRRLAELTPQDLKLVRYAALGDLIDHQLLRMKVKVNTFDLPVTAEEIDARFGQFASRFTSAEALHTAMRAQGIADEQALRDRLAARIQQEKYVAMRVDPLAAVSDEEVAAWYRENHAHIAYPERIEARHIFMRGYGRDPEEARRVLAEALAGLRENPAGFAGLAAELSEDPATKGSGGALGWMTRDRLPEDLANGLFGLPVGRPALVRSRLGWHLVEVTGRKPAGPRPFEESAAEIRAALEAVKRRDATRDFRNALRQFEAKQIEVFHDMMDD